MTELLRGQHPQERDNSVVKSWWKKIASKKTQSIPKQPNMRVFSVPLHASLVVARSIIVYVHDDHVQYGMIPLLAAKVGAFLKQKGMDTQGLFRISGNAKRVTELEMIFNSSPDYGSQLDWKGYTVHDAATLLRRYLNKLPEPVITHSLYQPFRDAIATESSDQQKVEACQRLIDQLPKHHLYLLFYLLDLLALFKSQQHLTHMDAFGLACIFTPVFLLDPDHALNPTHYKISQKVVEFLIQHQSEFVMRRNSDNDDALVTEMKTLSSSTTFNSPLSFDLFPHPSPNSTHLSPSFPISTCADVADMKKLRSNNQNNNYNYSPTNSDVKMEQHLHKPESYRGPKSLICYDPTQIVYVTVKSSLPSPMSSSLTSSSPTIKQPTSFPSSPPSSQSSLLQI